MVNLNSEAAGEVIGGIRGARPAHIPAPSVGGTIKKMIAVNPGLGADEIIRIIQSSLRTQGGNGDFGRLETIDEAHALELTRQSLVRKPG
jgi:hypothetical protein